MAMVQKKTFIAASQQYSSSLLYLLLLATSTILRIILLYFLNIKDALDTRVELVNGTNGLVYLKEIAFRLNNGLRPYEFGTSLPIPWLVGLFDLFARLNIDKAAIIIFDTIAASYIYRLAANRNIGKNDAVPLICSALYLLNPYSILTSASLSTASLLHMLMLGSIYHAVIVGKDAMGTSLMMAAGAASISPYAICVLSPILASTKELSVHKGLAIFLFFFGGIQLANYFIAESWSFQRTTYWSLLTFQSLRPNVGLYWYLCTEMFDFFRPFFNSFLQLHIFFYAFPAYIRFRKDPLFMAFFVIAIHSIFRSYPTVSDASLYLSLLPMFPEIMSRTKLVKPALIAMAFATVLAPVNWYYWIHQGSGNANFYYAVTLVYNAAQVLILIDTTRTYLWQQVLTLNPSLTKEQIYQK